MIPPAVSIIRFDGLTVDQLLDLLSDLGVLHVVLQSLGVLLGVLEDLSPAVSQCALP
jgi:hypothetical protein